MTKILYESLLFFMLKAQKDNETLKYYKHSFQLHEILRVQNKLMFKMFIERIFLPIFEYEKTIPQFGQPCSDDIF